MVEFFRRDDRLHVRRGLTAARYIEKNLVIHMVDYTGDVFSFMHDNAGPKTARILQDYIAKISFQVIVALEEEWIKIPQETIVILCDAIFV